MAPGDARDEAVPRYTHGGGMDPRATKGASPQNPQASLAGHRVRIAALRDPLLL